VADHATLEEGKWPDALCAVDNLVGDNEVARSYFFLERSDSGEGNDGAHAEVSQRCDVGLVLHLVWCEFMVESVSRDGRDWDRLAGGGRRVLEDRNRRRGLSPWGIDIESRGESEAWQGRDASAAYNGDVDGRCIQGKQLVE